MLVVMAAATVALVSRVAVARPTGGPASRGIATEGSRLSPAPSIRSVAMPGLVGCGRRLEINHPLL